MACSNPDETHPQNEIIELQLIARYSKEGRYQPIELTKENILVDKFKTFKTFLDVCIKILEKYHITNIHPEYHGTNITLTGEIDSLTNRESLKTKVKSISKKVTKKFRDLNLYRDYDIEFLGDFAIEVIILEQNVEEVTQDSGIPEPKCEPYIHTGVHELPANTEENTEDKTANASSSCKKEEERSDEIPDEERKKKEDEQIQEIVDRYSKYKKEPNLAECVGSSKVAPQVSIDIPSQEENVENKDPKKKPSDSQKESDNRGVAGDTREPYLEEKEESPDKASDVLSQEKPSQDGESIRENKNLEGTTDQILGVIIDKQDEVQGKETNPSDFLGLPSERKEIKHERNYGTEAPEKDETKHLQAATSNDENIGEKQDDLAISVKHDSYKKDHLPKEIVTKPKLLSPLPPSDGAEVKKTTTVTTFEKAENKSDHPGRRNIQQEGASSIQQHSVDKTPIDREKKRVNVPTHKKAKLHVGSSFETHEHLFSFKQPFTQMYLSTSKQPKEVQLILKHVKKGIPMTQTDNGAWQSPVLEETCSMKFPFQYKYKIYKTSWIRKQISEEEFQWRNKIRPGVQLDFDRYNLQELNTDSMIAGKNAFLDILLDSLTPENMRDLLDNCKFPYGYPLQQHHFLMIHKDKFRFLRNVSTSEKKCFIAVIFARQRSMDPKEAMDIQLAKLMSEGIKGCSPRLVPEDDKKALQNVMQDLLQQCFPRGFSLEDVIDIFFPMMTADQLVSFTQHTEIIHTASLDKTKKNIWKICHTLKDDDNDQILKMTELVVQRISTVGDLLEIHSDMKRSEMYRGKGLEQLVGRKILELMLIELDKLGKENILENVNTMVQILSDFETLPFDKAITSKTEEKIIQMMKKAGDACHKMVAQFHDIAKYPKLFATKNSKQMLLEALASATCQPLHQLFTKVLELKDIPLEQKELEKVFRQWLKSAILFMKKTSKKEEQVEKLDLSRVFQSPVLNENDQIINILITTLTEEFKLELLLSYTNEFEIQTETIANIFDKHVTNTLQETLATIEDPCDDLLEKYLKGILVGEHKKKRTTQSCVHLILDRFHTISTSKLCKGMIPENPQIWLIIKGVQNEVNTGTHIAFIATHKATNQLGDKILHKAFSWTEFIHFREEIKDKQRAKVCELLAAFHDRKNDEDWEENIKALEKICLHFENQRHKYTLMVEQLEDVNNVLPIDDLDRIKSALEERVKKRENGGVFLRDLESPSYWEDLEEFEPFADSLYRWKDVPSMRQHCHRYVEKDRHKPPGKQAQAVVKYLQTNCLPDFETKITTVMIKADDVPITDIKKLTEGSDKSILEEAENTEKALDQKQDEQKRHWLTNYDQIPGMTAKVKYLVSVQEIFELQQRRDDSDLDALEEFQHSMNTDFEGVYLKQMSDTMDNLHEVFVILHPHNPTRMLKVLIDSRSLVTFLREIIGEDLRNLIAMTEDKSHSYVAPETISAFLQVERLFKQFLSQETRDREYRLKEFARVMQEIFKAGSPDKQLSITSSAREPIDMYETLQKCNENLTSVRMLFRSITNRGEHTRTIVGKALSHGKVKFELNKVSKHCLLTLYYNDAEEGTKPEQQKCLQQEELNDLRGRALLISNSEREITESEIDNQDNVSQEHLMEFVEAIDTCFQIIEVSTRLCWRGHFDFQNYDQEFDSLHKENLSQHHITLKKQLKNWNKYLEEVQAKYFHMNYVWGDQLCELRRCLATNEETEKSKAILKFIHPQCQLPKVKQKLDGSLLEQLTLIGETLDDIVSRCTPYSRKLEGINIQNLEMKIKKGEPYIAHLAGTGSEMIPVIMNLYGDTVQKFPEPHNLLLCHEETRWDEINLLLARCFHPKRPAELEELFCIANIECLPSVVQFELTSHLQWYLSEDDNANQRNFYLCLVCKSSSQDPIIQHFAKYKHQVNGITTAKMETILQELWANVEVVTSEFSGLGKTEHIREKAAENGTGTVSIKISGPLNRDGLVEKFISLDMKKQNMLHIDIGDTPDTALLNGFLFELIVMGMVSTGTKIGILPTKNIAIEVANSIQHWLIDKLVFIKRFKTIHLRWANFSDYKISKEPNSSVRVVCTYLHSLKQRKIDSENIFLVGAKSKTALPQSHLDDKTCRELLWEYFGEEEASSEITFSTMKVYLDVLANQLKKMSVSDYFRVENIKEMVFDEYSKKIRSTLLGALIKMSKEFAQRSVSLCRSSQTSAVMDETQAMVKRVEGMIKWTDSNHLMVLFHEKDAQTVSPLYRNLMEVSHEVKELFKSQNKELEDFNHLSTQNLRVILKRIVCKDTGRDRGRMAEVEKNYVLTPDNMLKMVLISLRNRVRIPVILMGETGCGKTSLIRYLAVTSGVRLEIFNIHAGITEKQIKETVFEMHKKAMQSPKQELWLFVDEINTCDHLGFLCDIICHRKCEGRLLASNLVMLCACNPYRSMEETQILTSGLKGKVTNDKQSKLVYRVHPLPEAMIDYAWDYGVLVKTDEKEYIRCMVENITLEHIGPAQKQTLVSLLTKSQALLREFEEIEWSVSLRDVQRCLHLVGFFDRMLDEKAECDGTAQPTDERREKAVLLALTHCYYSRLPSSVKRSEYLTSIAEVFDSIDTQSKANDIADIIKKEQMDLLNRMQIPKGIAKNSALRENVFIVFVCILNKIPVFVVGKPGSSKSLSIQLLGDNLRGKESSDAYFKKLPQLYIVPYQGSESSTSLGLQKVFDTANEYYAHTRDQNVLPVVLLDEVGLAEISEFNPLKVLHNLLEPTSGEDLKVAVVGISNWALDAAKMNRAIHLSRPDLDKEELIDTAESIGSQYLDTETLKECKRIFSALAKAYVEYHPQQTQQNFHGLRDYYSFIKHVTQKFRQECLTEVINEYLLRNFGGRRKEDKNVLNIFQESLKRETMWQHIKLSSESVSLKHLILSNLEDFDARYLLLTTNGQTAIGYVQTLLEESKREYEIIIGSQFEEDQTEDYSYRVLNRIILCMEREVVLILKDLDHIYGSLYDMLNQNYHKVGTKQFCRVAIGPYFNPVCLVHDKFRCIVLVDKIYIPSTDPPFLNRFEKQYFELTDTMTTDERKIVARVEGWIKAVCSVKDSNFEKEESFLGYHSELIPSLVSKCMRGVSATEEEIFKKCKNFILMLATPDAVLRCTKSNLDSCETEDMEKKYFGNPMQNNLLDCVGHELDRVTKKKKGLRLVVLTHSNVHDNLELVLGNDLHRNFEVKKLAAFKSEKELTKQINKFCLYSDAEILFLQCKPSLDADHVALANSQIETVTDNDNKHVVFIIHIDQKDLEIQEPWQFNFLSGWTVVTIDMLEKKKCSLREILGKPISELIGEEIVSVEEIVKKHLFWAFYTFKYTSMDTARIKKTKELVESILQCEHLISELAKVIKTKIENETKKEDQKWQVEVACNKKDIAEASTFYAALMQKVEDMIKPTLAKVVFKLENLSAWESFLDNKHKDTRQIWKALLGDKEISGTSEIDNPEGPGCYQLDPIRFGLRFPFVKHHEDKLKETKEFFLEKEDTESFDEQQKELTEKYLKVFESKMQPLWTHPYLKSHMDTYLEDMLCLPWQLSHDPKLKSVTVKLFLWVLNNHSGILKSKELDPLERFVLCHLWYWNLESLLLNIKVLIENCLGNIPSGADKLTEMVQKETDSDTPPEDYIANFFCKEMLPTNELLQQCGSLEAWQRIVDILLLYVHDVSFNPEMIEFLRMCNEYASKILLPYNIEKDELIALGKIGKQHQREALVSEVLQIFIFDIPNRLGDRVPQIALQRFICQFIRRYIESDKEKIWLDSIIDKVLSGALPDSDHKFFGIVLISLLLNLGEETEDEEEKNLYQMLCTLLLNEKKYRDLNTICRRLEDEYGAGDCKQKFVVLLTDVVEAFGLRYMPSDVFGKYYGEQTGLELLQQACAVFNRNETYTVQCIVAVAFIRKILRSIAVISNEENREIDPTLLQALNNCICRSHSDGENKPKRLTVIGYLLQCLGNHSMAKIQTTFIPRLSIESSYLLEIDWPQRDVILGLGFNPYAEHTNYKRIERAWLDVEERGIEEFLQNAKRSSGHMEALFSYIVVNYTSVKAVRPLKDTEEKAIDLLLSKIDAFKEEQRQLLRTFLGKRDFRLQMLQLSEQSSLLELQQSSIIYRLMVMVVANNSNEKNGPFAVCMLSPQDAEKMISFWDEDLHGTLYTHYGCFQRSAFFQYTCDCGTFVAETSDTNICSICRHTVKSEKKEMELIQTTGEENEIFQYIRGMPPFCYRIFQIFLQGSLLSSIALGYWNDEKMTEICNLTEDKVVKCFKQNWKILKTMLDETDTGLCKFLHAVFEKFSSLIAQTQYQCLTAENMQMFEEKFIEKFKEEVQLLIDYDWYTKICQASGYRPNEIESILGEVYTDTEILTHSVLFQQTQEVSLQHLKHHFLMTYTECEDCDTPFLGYVLRTEKQLQLVKHLHPLISWTKKVHAILFRKVTESEVHELTVDSFKMKHGKNQDLDTLYEQFEKSWNQLEEDERLHILQLGTDFELPRMYSGQNIAHSLVLHHDSKIQILISALQKIQNDCLTEALRIAVQSKSPALNFLRRSGDCATVRHVPVLSASKEDVLDFEWDSDILIKFSQANTKCGMRRQVQYDLMGLEKELAVNILMGKKYLERRGVPKFVYAGQFFHANSAILDDIGKQIDQEKLPDEILNDLKERKSRDPDYAKSLNGHLDLVIPFIMKTGGKATETLTQYTKEWFPKESALLSTNLIPGQEKLKLCNLVHLYESVEELRMESAIFGLPKKFRQPLNKEQEKSIDVFIEKKYFTVKTILTALGRLVLRHIDENKEIIVPDKPMKNDICKPAFWAEGVEQDGKVTKAVEDKSPKQKIEDIFPQDLQLSHTCKTWEKIEKGRKEKEESKKKNFKTKTRSGRKRATRT